jgi:hypothetical protein
LIDKSQDGFSAGVNMELVPIKSHHPINVDECFAIVCVERKAAGLKWRQLVERSGVDPSTAFRAIRKRDFTDPGAMWVLFEFWNTLGFGWPDMEKRLSTLRGPIRRIEDERLRVDVLVHQYIFQNPAIQLHEAERLRTHCLGLVVPKATSTVQAAARRSPPRKLMDVAQIHAELGRVTHN